MKSSQKTKFSFNQAATKNLTLGDLIASTYGGCGGKSAAKILQLAMESHVIRYSRLPGVDRAWGASQGSVS
jgi:hypothetical protein